MALCSECGKNIGKELRQRTERVNEVLWYLGLTYHNTLGEALTAVDDALKASRFEPINSPIAPLAPGEYRVHVPVGDSKWVTACFHEMPSGRYELVAYVN